MTYVIVNLATPCHVYIHVDNTAILVLMLMFVFTVTTVLVLY